MPARSKSYKESLLQRLRDNDEAAHYLQAALEDSQSAFLVALKNVLDSCKVARSGLKGGGNENSHSALPQRLD